MRDPEAPPEADAIAGVPHPRHAPELFGQAHAEAEFLDAAGLGRMHHAWLITGPRGVGKATLAWRIARWLLAGERGAPTLDVDANHPVSRRISALSEPALFLLRRGWDDKAGRHRAVITVDEVRRLGAFFSLSRPDGGTRVVIVDAADELNPNAANALLKILEEPPHDTVMLLVCHQPRALLPTIRSRCRVLRCATLAPGDVSRALDAAGVDATDEADVLAELAGGSAGEAARLAQIGGAALYRSILDVLASMPLLDRGRALKLADVGAGAANAARVDGTLAMLDAAIARLARRGAGAPVGEAIAGEAELAARLAPGPAAARMWADLQGELAARGRHGRAVNLDPASLILDMTLRANETAARAVGQAP